MNVVVYTYVYVWDEHGRCLPMVTMVAMVTMV